jgi:caa(3)-type oxidase subunit IV
MDFPVPVTLFDWGPLLMFGHVLPARTYFLVFFTLLFLTGLTTGVAFMDLGPGNTVAALGIAFSKALLVALFFMHLRWSQPLVRIVMLASLLWLSILIGLTLGDIFTRDWIPAPAGWQSSRGAGGSFHGGGLVTDKPDSPHLLAPKIKARMYFGIASNDDQRQPDAKDKLREAFAAAKVPAEIEVYPAKHGWCVADMPADNTGPIYSKPDAERAWSKLVALYKLALA